MSQAGFVVPKPLNEPVLSYGIETRERSELTDIISELRSQEIEIPLIIDGKPVKTGDLAECRCPHDHTHLLARYHNAHPAEVQAAIESALSARTQWAALEWSQRASIFLKAAELLAGPWRLKLVAATMLCQSKNIFQAEIDAACELIDFWRFNVYYTHQLYGLQPENSRGVLNWSQYRPLEGFVYAVSPFNFTAIGGNLPTAPAIAGNVVVWKPASSAVYSNYFVMEVLREAGLPEGVINFIPGRSSEMGKLPFEHPMFVGLHFTGSTTTFRSMFKTIGENIEKYRNFPRIVGETGGKNFVILHSSANLDAAVTGIIRGAFEYQGQKCSAASRLYVPESIWPKLRERLLREIGKIKIGNPEDFSNFVNALIDKAAFEKVRGYLEYIKNSAEAKIIVGGGCNDSQGYFVEPTIVVAKNPKFKTMEEEIFGPVVTVYVYPDEKFSETLLLCDRTSLYGLAGSIFAEDKNAIMLAERILVNAAGNFYINDKPTGAVVGQQPFGGGRLSGTNDKSGAMGHMFRWISQRVIKQNLMPPKEWIYPFMYEKKRVHSRRRK